MEKVFIKQSRVVMAVLSVLLVLISISFFWNVDATNKPTQHGRVNEGGGVEVSIKSSVDDLNGNQRLVGNKKAIEFDVYALLPSLQGAEIPSGFSLDVEGNLIKDMNVQLYFDVLLSAISDLDDPEEMHRIAKRDLETKLSKQAYLQAIDLWERYNTYSYTMNNVVYELKPSYSGEETPEEYIEQIALMLDRKHELQRQILPDVYNWFESDNEYDRVQLEKVFEHLDGDQEFVSETTLQTKDLDKVFFQMDQYQKEYESIRNDVLAHQGLSPVDKREELQKLREKYYELGTAKYAQQKLKDMEARVMPPTK